MAKAKAAYMGECQICGHQQKLPDGLLSLHGYSRRWGFFEGKCYGSHELPFEQSIALIQAAIEKAEAAAEKLNKSANIRAAMTDPNNVVQSVFVEGKGRAKSRYSLLRGRLELLQDAKVVQFTGGGSAYCKIIFVADSGEVDYGSNSDNMAEVVRELNHWESERIRTLAKQHESYARWQRSRIKNWKPSKLQPVCQEGK